MVCLARHATSSQDPPFWMNLLVSNTIPHHRGVGRDHLSGFPRPNTGLQHTQYPWAWSFRFLSHIYTAGTLTRQHILRRTEGGISWCNDASRFDYDCILGWGRLRIISAFTFISSTTVLIPVTYFYGLRTTLFLRSVVVSYKITYMETPVFTPSCTGIASNSRGRLRTAPRRVDHLNFSAGTRQPFSTCHTLRFPLSLLVTGIPAVTAMHL